jgi:tetratricopeptide (TPR) repeat protein
MSGEHLPPVLRKTLATRVALALALVTAVGAARPALADAPDPATQTARQHYERGQQLFALQRFEPALAAFQRAFDASPIPAFLFNIGQCQRNLGAYEAAIFSFQRYLKLEPDAPNREQVEALIERLEAKLASDEALRRRSVEQPRPALGSRGEQRKARPIYRRWWFWTGLAVATAAGGVGAYALTMNGGPPDTTLDTNIVFGR